MKLFLVFAAMAAIAIAAPQPPYRPPPLREPVSSHGNHLDTLQPKPLWYRHSNAPNYQLQLPPIQQEPDPRDQQRGGHSAPHQEQGHNPPPANPNHRSAQPGPSLLGDWQQQAHLPQEHHPKTPPQLHALPQAPQQPRSHNERGHNPSPPPARRSNGRLVRQPVKFQPRQAPVSDRQAAFFAHKRAKALERHHRKHGEASRIWSRAINFNTRALDHAKKCRNAEPKNKVSRWYNAVQQCQDALEFAKERYGEHVLGTTESETSWTNKGIFDSITAAYISIEKAQAILDKKI